jgi:hypothetical protein
MNLYLIIYFSLLEPDKMDFVLLEVPALLYIQEDQVDKVLRREAVVDINVSGGEVIRSEEESNRKIFI